MNAANSRNVEVLDALLAAGADVNEQNSWGHSALMIAAMSRDVAMVKALIDAGVDIHARDISGETALEIARSDDVIRLLQKLE